MYGFGYTREKQNNTIKSEGNYGTIYYPGSQAFLYAPQKQGV